jgi:hypothetical protein
LRGVLQSAREDGQSGILEADIAKMPITSSSKNIIFLETALLMMLLGLYIITKLLFFEN